jgi:urease accessory protein
VETLDIICSADEDPPAGDEQIVVLTVERATLGKRRWRGVARDGREFGFDLDRAMTHGTVFHRELGTCYVIEQAPEPVLEIELGRDPGRAATVGWQIGNLHFPIEIAENAIRCPDDPAIRQLLHREEIAWRTVVTVFRPLSSGGHAHHHH